MMELVNKLDEVPLYQIEKWLKDWGNLYVHFKGKLVAKVGEAIHSETGETLYLYKEYVPELEDFHPTQTWARPMGMFLENKPYSNEPRFKPVTPIEAAKLLYPIINQQYLKSNS